MFINGVDISKYKNLVWTLTSRAGEPKLSMLINKVAIAASNDEKDAILNAIYRTAEPCNRVLDFRYFIPEECKRYDYHNICHHIDQASIKLFEELLLKTDGVYTLGIYDEVYSLAKNNYQQLSHLHDSGRFSLEAKTINLSRANVDLLTQTLSPHSPSEDSNNFLVDSLVASIEQRVHEEHFLNHNQSVIYLANQSAIEHKLTCAFRNESTELFWQYMQLGEEDCLANRLFKLPEIQYRMENLNDAYSRFYLVKKALVNGQLEFILFELNEALEEIKHNQDFASFIQQQDVKLIRVYLISSELSDQLYVPSLLDSPNNPRLESINRKPSDEVKNLVNFSNTLMFLYDETAMLQQLQLLALTEKPKKTFAKLPQSIQSLLQGQTSYQAPAKQAVHKNKEMRLEDRFQCVTNCIVTDKKTNFTYIGKSIDISTQGLAIRFDQDILFSDKVMISLPAINRRMGDMVKDQLYSCVDLDGCVLRVKAIGSSQEHKGTDLKREFISKYFSQLKINGLEEDLTGLSQLLRSAISGYHPTIPFTYTVDKRASFVETVCVNQYSKISNISNSDQYAELKQMLSSKRFSDYVISLFRKMTEAHQEITGYLVVLPNIKTDNGKSHPFWFEDFAELSLKQGGFEYVKKLKEVSNISIISVRLCKPSQLSNRFFADEYNHLKRLSPQTAESLSTKAEDILVYGEIKEISDIFSEPEQEPELEIVLDEECLIEV